MLTWASRVGGRIGLLPGVVGGRKRDALAAGHCRRFGVKGEPARQKVAPAFAVRAVDAVGKGRRGVKAQCLADLFRVLPNCPPDVGKVALDMSSR